MIARYICIVELVCKTVNRCILVPGSRLCPFREGSPCLRLYWQVYGGSDCDPLTFEDLAENLERQWRTGSGPEHDVKLLEEERANGLT